MIPNLPEDLMGVGFASQQAEILSLLFSSTSISIPTRVQMGMINPTQFPLIYLDEIGREGLFQWNPANLTTKVSADPRQGLWVPLAEHSTGSVGAYQRVFTGPASLLWFGAKTGGGMAAINYAALSGSNTACAAAGTGLLFTDIFELDPNSLFVQTSGVDWLGLDNFTCGLKAPAGTVAVGSLSAGQTMTNTSWRSMSFDMSGVISSSGFPSNLTILVMNDSEIIDCAFTGIFSLGLSVGGGNNSKIKSNYFARVTASPHLNEGIWIRENFGASSNFEVSGNILINTGMDTSGDNHTIIKNTISGWGYGGGITTEPGSSGGIVGFNICNGGTGTDDNGVFPGGIENWTSDCIVIGNECNDNSGQGISAGGPNCTYVGNTLLDNGQIGSGTGPVRSGIWSRYIDSNINGNGSVFSGNRCSDTGGGKQLYGFSDDNSSSGNTLVGNNFNGNVAAPTVIVGTKYDLGTPTLKIESGWSGFSAAAGGSGGGGILSIIGAVFGDTISIAHSADLQGLMAFGWISSTGNVSINFFNPTGGPVTIAAGVVYVTISKPINYVAY